MAIGTISAGLDLLHGIGGAEVIDLGTLYGNYRFTFSGTVKFLLIISGSTDARTGMYIISGYNNQQGNVKTINESTVMSFDTSANGKISFTAAYSTAGFVIVFSKNSNEFTFDTVTS